MNTISNSCDAEEVVLGMPDPKQCVQNSRIYLACPLSRNIRVWYVIILLLSPMKSSMRYWYSTKADYLLRCW